MAEQPTLEPDYAVDEELITGEAVALDRRAASFIIRGAGAAIDFAVSVVLVVGVLYLLGTTGLGDTFDQAAIAAFTIALLVTAIIVVPVSVETLSHGRSLGKLALGTRIVRDDGGAIGFRHALIRALLGFIEIFMTLGGMAVIVALLNDRSKRLGDLIAGTYSRYERVSHADAPVFDVPAELTGWAATADVARIPDRLSRRIGQFLAQAGALLPPTRARIGAQLAAEVSVFVSPLPAVHPEALLLAVTAIRRRRESTALELEEQRMQQLEPVLRGLPHGFPDRA